MSGQAVQFTRATDPDVVVEHLNSLLTTIRAAFRKAIPAATTFFRSQGKSVDRSLYSCLVRFEVRGLMAEQLQGLSVEQFEYTMDRVSNIGLLVRRDGFEIRILKARESGLPIAHSDARRDFYQHNLALEGGDTGTAEPLHLVVLWETDYDTTFSLKLVCPAGNASALDAAVPLEWQKSLGIEVVEGVESVEDIVGQFQPVDSELDEVTPKDTVQEPAEKGIKP